MTAATVPPPPPSTPPPPAPSPAPSAGPTSAHGESPEVVDPEPVVEPPPAVASPPREVPARTTSLDLGDLLQQIGSGDVDVPVERELTDPRDVARPERPVAAVIESTGGIAFDPTPASFVARAIGLVVDSIVTGALAAPGVAVVVGVDGPLRWAGLLLALVGFVGAAAWYARSVAQGGQWFGNRVTSTRVVNVLNGTAPSVAEAATRFVIRGIVSPVLLFGFLLALGHPQRRAFHDQIADTVVVGRSRQAWSVGDPTE